MRYLLLSIMVVASVGCGKEIGDECIVSSDCSPSGDRICLDPSVNGGYCTVMGCDLSTCPDEAVCVRFFTGGFANKRCENSPDECSLDELCDINKYCVPRSSEIRYCMKACSSNDDCRHGYECRDFSKMKAHGGEPVLEPGATFDESAPKFCAAAPASS